VQCSTIYGVDRIGCGGVEWSRNEEKYIRLEQNRIQKKM
jgi:hypothetical protein